MQYTVGKYDQWCKYKLQNLTIRTHHYYMHTHTHLLFPFQAITFLLLNIKPRCRTCRNTFIISIHYSGLAPAVQLSVIIHVNFFLVSAKVENFISFKLEVCVTISMMETCLSMAPFLKGLNCCLRGLSPPPTLPALGSQVELTNIWFGISHLMVWC